MSPPAVAGWNLERELGRGADATVWLARPAAGGDPVALKVIPLVRLRDPAAHLREAWAAGSTGSRFVVAVLDAGQHDGHAWLAMEIAAGDAAALATRAGGRLKPASAARIARDAARGLQALADHGFVHRDVKPSNILLRPDGTAMIGDLAPLRGGGTATRSADLSGTPAYLSPEQVLGRLPDARSDVHALGATLFTLIAGRPPFTADGTLDLLRAIAETPAPDLRAIDPTVPPAIADVVATALAKDPALRQQRAAVLAAELDEAIAGRSPSRAAVPAARSAPSQPFAWPGWLPFAAAGIAALCGIVLAAAASRPSRAALAGQAAEVEAAAVRQDRLRSQAAAETLARLRQRLELMRQERDAAARQAAAPPPTSPAPAARPADPPPIAAVPPPAPAAAPVPTPPTPPPPPAAVAPIIVSIKPIVQTPSLPVVLPPGTAPPIDAEPDPGQPRIGSTTVAGLGTICGFTINPLAVQRMAAWNTSRALWQSCDRGATWTAVAPPARQAANRRRDWGSSNAPRAQWHGAYGLIPGSGGWGGWLTRDGGGTWQELAPPVSVIELESTDQATLRALTADGTIYAAGKIAGQRRTWRLFASSDAGAAWRDVADLQADRLVLHAAGERLLLLAGNGAWQASLDLGRTWQDILIGSHEKGAWCADGSRLRLLSWRAGMSVLDLASGLWSVEAMAQPLDADVPAIAIDPRDPRTAFAIDPRQGLVRTIDQGRTWRSCVQPAIRSPANLLIVGQRRPRLHCAVGNALVSLDLTAPCDDLFPVPPAVAEGALRLSAPRPRFAGGFACEPAGGAVYAWEGNAVWRSADGAETWQLLASQDLEWANASMRLAATPGQRAVVLQPGTGNGIGYLFREDGRQGRRLEMPSGTRWQAGPAMTADGRLLASVWPPGTNGKSVQIIESTDDGRTWREAGAIASNGVMLIPVGGAVATIYAVGSDLVASLDAGRTAMSAGRVEDLARTWCSAGDRCWVVDRAWSTLSCFDARTRRWRSQPLGALAAWTERADWRAFAVDPDDPQRLWVVANGGNLAHSSDGGRSWHWLTVPLQASTTPNLAFQQGPKPRLLVSVPDGIQVLDVGATKALFRSPLTAP